MELPLLWGFMPFAFSYYVFYALLASAVMILIIKLAWPHPPEGLFEHPNSENQGAGQENGESGNGGNTS